MIEKTKCRHCGRTIYVYTRNPLPSAILCSSCYGGTHGVIDEQNAEYLRTDVLKKQLQERIDRLTMQLEDEDVLEVGEKKMQQRDLSYSATLLGTLLSDLHSDTLNLEKRAKTMQAITEIFRMASDVWPKIPEEQVIAIDYEETKLFVNPEERAVYQRMLIKRCKELDAEKIDPLLADILNAQAQLLEYLGKKEEAHDVWLEYKACLVRLK